MNADHGLQVHDTGHGGKTMEQKPVKRLDRELKHEGHIIKVYEDR